MHSSLKTLLSYDIFEELNIYFPLQEAQEKLQKEEDARNSVEQAKKKAEAEIKNLKQEMRDVEAMAAKVWIPICFYSENELLNYINAKH